MGPLDNELETARRELAELKEKLEIAERRIWSYESLFRHLVSDIEYNVFEAFKEE